LVAIIIAIALIFVLDTIVSILRLLSTQTVDLSVTLVTLVYPVLDAVLFFPAVLIFWAVRRRMSTSRLKGTAIQEQKLAEAKQAEGKTSFSSFLVAGASSM
jgi:bacteriorhodopsin